MSGSLIGSADDASGATGADGAELSDRELLDRFLDDRDEAAFEHLVDRHGPRVLRICRGRLGVGQDAEDAYQGTFLLLATRGESIRCRENVGAWLCGVARRVASRARLRADRRRRVEGTSIDLREVADRDRRPVGDDVRPMIRAEIERLPEKYRRPIELCYRDGLTSEQAATLLQCPTGTLKWRLSRARDDLRDRLRRAGVLLAALLAWLGMGRPAGAAVLPAPARPSSSPLWRGAARLVPLLAASAVLTAVLLSPPALDQVSGWASAVWGSGAGAGAACGR